MNRWNPSDGLQGTYIDDDNYPYTHGASAQTSRRQTLLRSLEISLLIKFGSEYNNMELYLLYKFELTAETRIEGCDEAKEREGAIHAPTLTINLINILKFP